MNRLVLRGLLRNDTHLSLNLSTGPKLVKFKEFAFMQCHNKYSTTKLYLHAFCSRSVKQRIIRDIARPFGMEKLLFQIVVPMETPSKRHLFTHSNVSRLNRFDTPPGGYRGPHDPSKMQSRIWYILKIVLMGTGALVWAGLLIACLSVEGVNIQEVSTDEEEVNDGKISAMLFYNVEKLSDKKYLKKIVQDKDPNEREKLLASEDVKNEVTHKAAAMFKLLDKIRGEESIAKRFGNKVDIHTFLRAQKYSQKNDEGFQDTYNANRWFAQCFIEGPLGLGILSFTFERDDRNSDWVPTSVHVETLERSGDIVCDVARPLPHGLKNFTRFSR